MVKFREICCSQNDWITDNNNWGWKGTLETIQAKPQLTAESSRTGCSGHFQSHIQYLLRPGDSAASLGHHLNRKQFFSDVSTDCLAFPFAARFPLLSAIQFSFLLKQFLLQLICYPTADFQCNKVNLVKVSPAVLVKLESFGLVSMYLR